MSVVRRFVLSVLLSLGLGPIAVAAPIQGGITFSGLTFVPVDSSWNLTSLGTATGVDFACLGVGVTCTDMNDGMGDRGNGEFIVAGAVGDFSGLVFPTVGNINDFALSDTSFVLWSVGNFEFHVDSIATVSQSSSFLNLAGSGALVDTSGVLDNANSLWTFTGQTAGVTGLFSWSSTNAVPVPTPLALFALGLLALASLFRRRVCS